MPQFIEAEDTILGPVTARQFLILILALVVDAILYKLLHFVPFLIAAIPFTIAALIMAFTRINGMPFHFFLLNLIQTFRRPQVRVWDKTPSDKELKLLMQQEPAPPRLELLRKAPLSSTRLQELTLVVNTGGAYKPEDE